MDRTSSFLSGRASIVPMNVKFNFRIRSLGASLFYIKEPILAISAPADGSTTWRKTYETAQFANCTVSHVFLQVSLDPCIFVDHISSYPYCHLNGNTPGTNERLLVARTIYILCSLPSVIMQQYWCHLKARLKHVEDTVLYRRRWILMSI